MSRSASPLPPGTPRRRRHPWRALARAASWHRRTLAVLAAAATVLCGLAATAPPGPPTHVVVRAAKALPAGAVLRADDLATAGVSEADVPDEAVADVGAVVGRRLVGPVTRGEILTVAALVSPRSVSRAGRVLAPVRLSDADTVALLRPGDVVDVVAADPQTGKAGTVAAAARVVTVPPATQDAPGAQPGALVVLEVDTSSVPALTRALSGATLTVIWS